MAKAKPKITFKPVVAKPVSIIYPVNVSSMMKKLLIYSLLLVSLASMGLAFEPEMVTKDLVGFWALIRQLLKAKLSTISGRRIMALSRGHRKVSKVNLVKPCRLTVKRIWWKSHIMPV